MKNAVLAASLLAFATPVLAQQAALDHAHLHGGQATPPAAGPQPPQTPPAAPGGGRGGPQIEVPWNDAIPPGTADHAARALKESSRHGEWADIKMADATLKAWVVYPERLTAAGVEFVTSPRDEAYGRVVVFVDIEGNRWDLLGPQPS